MVTRIFGEVWQQLDGLDLDASPGRRSSASPAWSRGSSSGAASDHVAAHIAGAAAAPGGVGIADELEVKEGAAAVKDAPMSTNGDACVTSPTPTPGPVDIAISPGTAAPMYIPRSDECSVQSCIAAFCKEETLTGENMFACEACYRLQHPAEPANPKNTIKRLASKQMLIETPPRVLTLHLKRFEQSDYSLRKLSTHVEFPTVLDIAPFCCSNCPVSVYDGGATGVRYGLYGLIVHQGRLSSGHYLSYVRGLEGDWHCISDSSVSKVTEREVLAAEAYILFYERLH